MSAHETSVWNRISEGSQQAECTCGWKGSKRTAIGGLAYTDADRHTEAALQRPTPESSGFGTVDGGVPFPPGFDSKDIIAAGCPPPESSR